jgi:sedoheptulose-bisphosphatase
MGIYGPRTIYCIALKDAPGCHEFLLQDDGKWLHVKETTEIGERLKRPLIATSCAHFQT